MLVRKKNINENEAKNILYVLGKMGVIFYCGERTDLSKIYLNPLEIAKEVEKSLQLPDIHLNLKKKKELLEKLKEDFIPLQQQKDLLEAKAHRFVQIISYGILFFLVGQILLFGRLTWWDYDWGVMEPVTYFTSVVETVLAGYIFYMLNRKEYENTTAREILKQRRFRNLLKSRRYDLPRYQSLKQRIEELQQSIEYKH